MAVINTGLSRSVFLCIMHGHTRGEPQRVRTRNELQSTHPVRRCADPCPYSENPGRNFTVGHRRVTSLTPGMSELRQVYGASPFHRPVIAASMQSRVEPNQD